MRRPLRPSGGVLVLAILAYLPAFTAAPGRMPSDSKLYLYLDPLRLLSDAFHNFDPRQFAGWVPHQHIAYLWPSGPWFGAFEILGVPDWIAHRLWIGTLLFAAGLGVRWAARLLGLSPAGALAAAVVYQCSPYLLPYVSRTSVMLLPWAALGWTVGLTMLATLRSTWRHAALLALVVLTVGAVNATALLMIVPAPLLWLVHAASSHAVTWRHAAACAGRVGVLSILVSVWWAVALLLQGRHGADVLAFSETLEAVSFTSSSTEVLRGLGYWLFYVRDPYSATTTAAIDHLASGRTIAIGLVVVLVGVAGLVLTRWAQRRYAAWLVLAGVVLAVGIHPIGGTSPLMAFVTGDGTSGLALALRSSTRAVPVSLFGLALGAGALVSALRTHRWRRRRDVEHLAAAAVVVLAVAGVPALWTGGLVDPALERDQDPPAAWTEAATALDDGPPGFRVLQVPGAEFGSFRWGHTVDQPLPGLSDTPLVTRDLLPLGSPAAMDLLYALDDRFQRGVLEPDAIAPVARLFGADTVWLANDLAYDRYRTPRPDTVAAEFAGGAAGLLPPRSFGAPESNVPTVPMVDEDAVLLGAVPAPLPPVQLLEVTDPVPVVRAVSPDSVVLVAGDGEGLVDAAAAGLMDGSELIRYAGSLDADELSTTSDDARLVVVTDTNRSRARHWRSSQDATGFTEDGTDRPAVLRPADGDARLALFEPDRVEHRTLAVQVGPVVARATAYGEPFAYRPEARAWRAIDGDPTSAWLVADRFDAVGERLRLELSDPERDPARHLVVRQPDADAGARHITVIDVRLDGGDAQRVHLDETSRHAEGQHLAIEGVDRAATIDLEIVATAADPAHPEHLGAVGFAEVNLGLEPTREVVRLPTATLATVDADDPLAIVLTRDRVGPTDRWRDDPEPVLVRELTLATAHEFDVDVTVRLDQRAADAVLAELLDSPGAVASERLTGSAASRATAAFDGRPDTAWISAFGPAVGTTLRFDVDAAVVPGSLTIRQPRLDTLSRISTIRVSDDAGDSIDVDLTALDDGAGSATFDASSLNGPSRTIEITGVEPRTTIDRRYGEPIVLPVAIGEVEGVGVVRVEPHSTIDTGCRDDLLTVDGRPVPLRVRGAVDELLAGGTADVEPCTDALRLGPGTHVLESAPGATGLQLDRVVLTSSVPTSSVSTAVSDGGGHDPTAVVESASRTGRDVTVSGCTDGCWVVLGEGHSDAWAATADGTDLGTSELVDGGFNGWFLGPGADTRDVTLTWTPQPVLTAGLLLSGLGVVLCAAFVMLDRRRRPLPDPDRPDVLAPEEMLGPRRTRREIAVVGGVWVVAAALLIAPIWALAPLPLLALALWRRTLRPVGLIALALSAIGAGVILWRVVSIRPAPDAAWVLRFDDLHRPGMFVVTALVASALLLDRRAGEQPAPDPTPRA